MLSGNNMEESFRRKMHALTRQYADIVQMYPDEAHQYLKDQLIEKGMIKKSTNELDIKGLAKTCNMLNEWIDKNKLPL